MSEQTSRRGFIGRVLTAVGVTALVPSVLSKTTPAPVTLIQPPGIHGVYEDLETVMNRQNRSVNGGRYYLSQNFVLRDGDFIVNSTIDTRGYYIDATHDPRGMTVLSNTFWTSTPLNSVALWMA
jgi:hypothetical protein